MGEALSYGTGEVGEPPKLFRGGGGAGKTLRSPGRRQESGGGGVGGWRALVGELLWRRSTGERGCWGVLGGTGKHVEGEGHWKVMRAGRLNLWP